MTRMPTGVRVIGALHAFSAMFTVISLIISIPFIIVVWTQDLGLGAITTLDAIWGYIMAGFHAAIASAIFSRKSWAILAVTIISGVGFIFAILSIISGNMFAIFSLIINAAVIAYMRTDKVRRWLSDDTLG